MAAGVSANGLKGLLDRALTLARKPALHKTGRLLVTVGNQSGDADSIVSALGLAAVVAATSNTTPIPVATCSREQGALKPELAPILEQAGLTMSDLVYLDDIEWAALPEDTAVALVDHNAAEEPVASSLPESAVVAVVDHHLDSGACSAILPPEALPSLPWTAAAAGAAEAAVAAAGGGGGPGRCVAFLPSAGRGVGSSASLVGHALAALAPSSALPGGSTHGLAPLLAAVICLDTHSLTNSAKTTALDCTAMTALLALAEGDTTAAQAAVGAGREGVDASPPPIPPHLAAVVECALGAKFDPAFWAGMTLPQVLRYDTKTREVPGGGVGVAAALAPLSVILGNAPGATPAQDILDFAQDTHSSVVVVMTFVAHPVPARQLAVFLPPGPGAEGDMAAVTAALTAPAAGLQLQQMPDEDLPASLAEAGLLGRAWRQGNVDASRKVVLPLLQGAWGK